MTFSISYTTQKMWIDHKISRNWKIDDCNSIVNHQKYLVLFTHLFCNGELYVTSIALIEINELYLVLDTFIVNYHYYKTKLSLVHKYQIMIVLLQYYKTIKIHYLELRCTNQSALNTYAYYGYKIYLQRVNYYNNPNSHAILLKINSVQSLSYWR